MQIPLYRDTKPGTGDTTTQVVIPGWNDIFIKFKDKNYSDSTHHSDLDIRNVDKSFFSED
jgi:hypothetical protein